MPKGFVSDNPRRWGDLMKGLPAVLAFLAVAALFVRLQFQRDNLSSQYRSAANHAFSNETYPQAVTCLERLTDLAPGSPEVDYNLAVALAITGNEERAVAIMRELAPNARSGFAQAHVWLADHVSSKSPVSSEQLVYVITHLRHAHGLLPRDPALAKRLADCLWLMGFQEEALAKLRRAAELAPTYNYDLFHAYKTLGRVEEANESAQIAERYLRRAVTEDPLDRASRKAWAEIRLWLNDYTGAESVLQQGLALDPNGSWEQLLSSAVMARFAKRRSEGAGIGELLEYLAKGLSLTPDSAEVLDELIAFGREDENEEIEELLHRSLSKGTHPALVHFVLGARAWHRDDADDAIFHMQRAYSLDNRLANAANNLAYFQITGETGDLDLAHRLVNAILSKFPEHPAYRETRGQILTKLGRWEDALDDLEYALPSFPKNKRLHESLARCYHNLGQHKMAKQHATVWEQLSE